VKIAVDAMGGDHAPESAVAGAAHAAREYGISVVLVGQEARITPLLPAGAGRNGKLEVFHAPDTIDMGESPLKAVRRKPNSSLVVCAQLVKEGRAAAMLSAGSTGAGMAASLFTLGRIAGIDRPAIGALLPNRKGFTVLVDAGADRDVQPAHLVQYAIMGSIYSRELLGVANPRVGLINVGSEEGKGNEQAREAHILLKEAPVEFIGNVEGPDLFSGKVDVAVCDGFTGNVVLKVGEGAAEFVRSLIREEVGKSPLMYLPALALRPVFTRIRKRTDYGEKGGAPLLGINGVSVICHGRSAPIAIANGIRTASEAVKQGIIDKIRDQISG